MMGKGAQQGAVLSVDFGYAQQPAYHGCWCMHRARAYRVWPLRAAAESATRRQLCMHGAGFTPAVAGFCGRADMAHCPGFGTVQAAHMNSMRL